MINLAAKTKIPTRQTMEMTASLERSGPLVVAYFYAIKKSGVIML